MDTFRAGVQYFSGGISKRVTGARGLRLGDTTAHPGTNVQTYWFKDLAEFEANRREVFGQPGKFTTAPPVPIFEPLFDMDKVQTEDGAAAELEAGGKALTLPIGASIFFLVGMVLAMVIKKEAVAEEAKEAAELEKLKKETAELEEEEAAAGAQLAIEGKHLPDHASPAAKRGHAEMTATLKAQAKEPVPDEYTAGVPHTPEELKNAEPVDPPANPAPDGRGETVAPPVSAPAGVDGDALIPPAVPSDPAVEIPAVTATPPPEVVPANVQEQTPPEVGPLTLNDRIGEHIPAKNHRLNDLANMLNMDPSALRDFIESPASRFYLFTGNWVKLKEAAQAPPTA